jgi:Flp pilus assembly protein TadB
MIAISYFVIGIAFFGLVYAFPFQYRAILKRALLVIKTAGLKSKQAQKELERRKKKEPVSPEQIELNEVEIKAEQKNYSEKLDKDIEQKTIEYQQSSDKATRALFGLIIAWPLMLFVVSLAFFMESIYLTESDIKEIEAQL